MSSSRTKTSLSNLLTGTFRKSVALLLPFIIKTIIVSKLGYSYLGINTLFSSILQVLAFADLGIGSAMVFFMYKPLEEKDYVKVKLILNLYRKVYLIIGVIVLTSGLAVMPFLKIFIHGDIPNQLNLQFLFLIYLANSTASYFFFAYKKSLLIADQKLRKEDLISTIVIILMSIIQIIVLLVSSNYYLYIIVLPISTIIANVISALYTDKLYPFIIELDLDNSKLSKSDKTAITKKVSSLFFHKLSTTMILSSPAIIISIFLEIRTVTIFGNYYYIVSSIIGLIQIFYLSIMASVGNSLIVHAEKQKQDTFYTLTFVNIWIVTFCSASLLCLFQPFMVFWMGLDLIFNFYIILLIVIYFYSSLQRRITLTYKDAAGLWREDILKPIIAIVLNVGLMLLLVPLIGVAGAIIPNIIVMVSVYFPFETYVVHKYILKCSPLKYIMNTLKYLVVATLICFVCYFICDLVEFDRFILTLLYRATICVIVPNIIFFISFVRTSEMKNLFKRIFILLKKEEG